MAQQFAVKQESPALVTISLSGRIGPEQWIAGLDEMAACLPEGRLTSILVLGNDFQDWGPGDWDDFGFQFSFQHKYDPRIGRMAIVADRKWEDRALMFAGKGLRKIEIEFFTPDEIERARQWLAACPQETSS